MIAENETSKSQKYKILFADTVIFALGNLGSKVILFFLVPLYTNCLSKEEYGISDLVFTVAQFLIPFVSLVIFDSVLRFGLTNNANTESILKSSWFVIMIGSVITVVITPAFSIYKPLSPWKWYLCIYVILTMIGNVEMNYLKLINLNKAYAVISILHTLVLAVSNVLLLSNIHLGIKGYLISTILGSATTVILAFFLGKIYTALKNGQKDNRLLKDMICFSAPLILNNISWWVIQSSDKIMIEEMVGAAELGLYTTASKIPSLINVIISIFSQAWGISSVREFESTNDKSFYSDVFISYSVIGFGAAICINTFLKPFMAVYVSYEFFDSWTYVPLLLVSASFSAVASYFGSLYGALKKSVNNMKSTLAAATINFLVNYFCILRFGAFGAVIGTVTAYTLLALYRMIDVLRFIKFDPKWKVFIFNAILVFSQAILVALDYKIAIGSVITILLFFVVNHKKLMQLLLSLMRIVKSLKR